MLKIIVAVLSIFLVVPAMAGEALKIKNFYIGMNKSEAVEALHMADAVTDETSINPHRSDIQGADTEVGAASEFCRQRVTWHLFSALCVSLDGILIGDGDMPFKIEDGLFAKIFAALSSSSVMASRYLAARIEAFVVLLGEVGVVVISFSLVKSRHPRYARARPSWC